MNCNNGGLINPENPPQNIGFLKASEKENKREEASHYYRPGQLFEIVFSLSRTENFYGATERKYFDLEYSPGSTKATGFLEDLGIHLETGVQFTESVCSPCAAKAAVKIGLFRD